MAAINDSDKRDWKLLEQDPTACRAFDVDKLLKIAKDKVAKQYAVQMFSIN